MPRMITLYLEQVIAQNQNIVKKFRCIFLTMMLSACSGISIIGVDKSDNFQISNYRTFDFYKIDASGDALSEYSKQNLELLKAAITKELQAKGVTQNSTDPDLLVNIGVVVLEKVQAFLTRVYPDRNRTYLGYRENIRIAYIEFVACHFR